MKKLLVIGLIGVLVLSLGAMSFADAFNGNRQGNGQGRAMNKDFNSGYGRESRIEELVELTDLTEEEILESDLTLYEIAKEEGVLEEFRPEESRNLNQNRNLNLYVGFQDNAIDNLIELTDLTKEEILESELTIHELAEEEGVLEELHSLMLENKTEVLNELVEEGTITQEKADFMIDRMENMDGSQERRGSKGVAGRGFNRK